MAKIADEWNAVNITPEVYAHKTSVLEGHCAAVGRWNPATIARSMMSFGLLGPSQDHIEKAVRKRQSMFGGDQAKMSTAEFLAWSRERSGIAGSTDEVVEHLGRLAELGCQEVQFQRFDFDSDDVPRYLRRRDSAPRGELLNGTAFPELLATYCQDV